MLAGFWKMKIENAEHYCPGQWNNITINSRYREDERDPNEEFKQNRLSFRCVEGKYVTLIYILQEQLYYFGVFYTFQNYFSFFILV